MDVDFSNWNFTRSNTIDCKKTKLWIQRTWNEDRIRFWVQWTCFLIGSDLNILWPKDFSYLPFRYSLIYLFFAKWKYEFIVSANKRWPLSVSQRQWNMQRSNFRFSFCWPKIENHFIQFSILLFSALSPSIYLCLFNILRCRIMPIKLSTSVI